MVGRVEQLTRKSRRTKPVTGKPTLIAFAGLPGTGKTTIARELARQIGAVYLRIDTIEQALRTSRPFKSEIEDAGYRAAIALAQENLTQGLTVVTDAVNPLAITRDAFAAAAHSAGAKLVEVELICSDQTEHGRRIETRTADIEGHKLPTWTEVATREYELWTREHLVIDTASHSAEAAVTMINKALAKHLYHSERDPSVASTLPQGDMMIVFSYPLLTLISKITTTEDRIKRITIQGRTFFS